MLPATSSSVRVFFTLPGTPTTRLLGGTMVPAATTAPAPTMEPAPITAWSRTTAFMPMRQLSSTVQP